MGQIEELEKELAELRRQVGAVQYGLDHAQNTVKEIKATMVQEANRINMMQQTQQPTYQQPAQSQYTQPSYSQQRPVYVTTSQPTYSQPVQPKQEPQQRPVYVAAGQNQQNQQQTQQAVPQPQLVQPRKSSINESWIGKHLMGVFASILIFIALVLFASLIIPYLGNTLKIVLMFGVSGALTAFSYVKHRKKPENTFFTALLACGLGCCYLSVLVTRIYFKTIIDLVMYLLLFVWTVVVLFMARKEGRLFQVIGNAGFAIAVGLSVGLEDKSLVIPMLAYILVTAAAHQVVFWKNKVQRNVQFAVNIALTMIYSIIIMINIGKQPQAMVAFIIIMAVALILFAYFLFADMFVYDASRAYFSPAAALLFVVAYAGFDNCVPQRNLVKILVYLALCAFAELSLILSRQKNGQKNGNFFTIGWITLSVFAVEILAFVRETLFFNSGVLFALAAAIFIYGAVKKDDHFKNQALAIGISLSFLELFGKLNIVFCVMGFVFAMLCFVVEGFISERSSERKLFTYLYTLATLGCLSYAVFGVMYEFTGFLLFQFVIMPVGIMNLIMIATKFYKGGEGADNIDLRVTLNIINGILLSLSLINIFNLDKEPVGHGLSVVFTTALALVNVKRHLSGNSKEKLYAGIKLGIVILASLFSYDAHDYVISVAMLVFAIVCIVVGFSKRYGAKELRIYGLVLSMICVAKFVMIDISYANTLGHAFSFLISGVLCFGISAIYNYFEKQG